ncbi:MAG: carbohydrate ABC transporter permease, partial [Abitibacteriaceae bacterium]|nr:carbohydrate ABC transporter permease [Abditibacteriaceae bacterium]
MKEPTSPTLPAVYSVNAQDAAIKEPSITSGQQHPSDTPRQDSGRVGEGLLRVLVYVLLCLAAVLMLMPLVWLVAATTKNSDDLLHYTFFATRPVSLFGHNFALLKPFSVDNFKALFAAIPFGRYMLNSVFISCTTVIIQLFFSSLAGFALAKYEFRGKKLI